MEALSRDSRSVRPFFRDPLMVERSVTIVNKLGIHARPSAELVKCAAKFRSNTTIIRDDLEVNGKSIMGVMMLAAEFGSSILIRAEGEDEQAALDALAAVVADGFGE